MNNDIREKWIPCLITVIGFSFWKPVGTMTNSNIAYDNINDCQAYCNELNKQL